MVNAISIHEPLHLVFMPNQETFIKTAVIGTREEPHDMDQRLVKTNVRDAVLTEIADKHQKQVLYASATAERRRAILFADAMNQWARMLGLDRNLTVEEIEALAPEAMRCHRTMFWKGAGMLSAGIMLVAAPLAGTILAGIFLHSMFFFGTFVFALMGLIGCLVGGIENRGPLSYFFGQAPTAMRKAFSFLRKGHYHNSNPEWRLEKYSDEDIKALRHLLEKNRQ